ncbi:MAG: nickel pincer cofactor biosynthesis protein LarC [Candidatus Latescibacteria bacterium]|nr:nickel pincer cofactor biosynthesis protein LarC [Candidatus Latescibacterota bacterium]
MRVAYFDCPAGISGDMALGALVDAGLALESLQEELAKLDLHEYHIRARKVAKHGISATKVDVIAQEGHVHRNLSDILEIIGASDIRESAKGRAEAIFRRLAAAEAEVHGVPIDRIHFHEVGAVDAIVDVVGAVVGLELLGVESVYASVLRFGTGTVKSAHGVLPVPVPAVVSLCRGQPAERTGIPFELTTPTGAAILTTLASGIGERVVSTAERVGYGAGNRDIEQVPNLLRVEIGDLDTESQVQRLTLIETNIDDMNPEVYGYLVERLLEGGARDAYLTPVVMKKGRPGVMVSVLADPARASSLTETLLRETTTLGLRITQVDRLALPRSSSTVETPYGTVALKVAQQGERRRVTPEFEDCARLAREGNVPILDVYSAALRAAEGEQADT